MMLPKALTVRQSVGIIGQHSTSYQMCPGAKKCQIRRGNHIPSTVSTILVSSTKGVFNNSPCMVDGNCSKRYPRDFISEIITGNDGYPLYSQRSVMDNGRSVVVMVKGQEFGIDNSWVLPYWPISSKVLGLT